MGFWWSWGMSEQQSMLMLEATVDELADKAWIGLVTTMTKSYVEQGVPLIRNSDIKEGYVRTEGMINLDPGFAELYFARTVRTGDIVSVHTGDIATSSVIKEELNGAHGFATINTRVDSKQIYNHYLCYFFNSAYFKYQAYGVITGDGRDNLNLKEFLELKVLYPADIKQQQKIANILSTVDKLIENTQTLIDKYTAIKQGMMADLFTRGIDLSCGPDSTPASNPSYGQLRPSFEDAPELYKETDLGWVPKGWEVSVLGEICAEGGGGVQTGPFGSQLHAHDYKDEGVPIITVEHLGDNKILHEGLPLVGEDDYNRLRKYRMTEGDLIFSRVGSIDRCAYVSKLENGWMFSGRCLRVRIGCKNNSSRYFSYQLNNESCRNWILNHSVGSTMACLNTSILSGVPLVQPDISEQKVITSRLDAISELIDICNEEKAVYRDTKKGLMQDLLTGKVKVK